MKKKSFFNIEKNEKIPKVPSSVPSYREVFAPKLIIIIIIIILTKCLIDILFFKVLF